jgi:hypothetical protein
MMKGKSLIFLCPEEEALLKRLKATAIKIHIHIFERLEARFYVSSA